MLTELLLLGGGAMIGFAVGVLMGTRSEPVRRLPPLGFLVPGANSCFLSLRQSGKTELQALRGTLAHLWAVLETIQEDDQHAS